MFSQEFYKLMDTYINTSTTDNEKIDALKQMFIMLDIKKHENSMTHTDTRYVINELLKHDVCLSLLKHKIYPVYYITPYSVMNLYIRNMYKRCRYNNIRLLHTDAVRSFLHIIKLCNVVDDFFEFLRSFIVGFHCIYMKEHKICGICNCHLDIHEYDSFYGKICRVLLGISDEICKKLKM